MPLKSNRNQHARLRKWHRLMACIVGIQLCIWLLTGLFFNLTPAEYVHARTYLNAPPLAKIKSTKITNVVDVQQLMARFPETELIELIALAEQPYFLLTHQQTRYAHQCQQQTLIAADTGEQTVIDDSLAKWLAKQRYNGLGKIIAVEQHSAPHWEWPKHCAPLWRIKFDDELNTRVYINAGNGELIGHKNKYSAIADWMFRLHFLDYTNQGRFNHLLAWIVAGLALIQVFSGLTIIYANFKHRRYSSSS